MPAPETSSSASGIVPVTISFEAFLPPSGLANLEKSGAENRIAKRISGETFPKWNFRWMADDDYAGVMLPYSCWSVALMDIFGITSLPSSTKTEWSKEMLSLRVKWWFQKARSSFWVWFILQRISSMANSVNYNWKSFKVFRVNYFMEISASS